MVFDDFPAIQDNPDVTGENSIRQLFRDNFWGKAMDAENVQHHVWSPMHALIGPRFSDYFLDDYHFFDYRIYPLLLSSCCSPIAH